MAPSSDVWKSRIIIFVLLVNISFPVFASALTSLTINATFDNSVLNTLDLLNSGIVLTNATSITLNLNDVQIVTFINPDNWYATWDTNGIRFQVQDNQIDKFLGTKWFLKSMDVINPKGNKFPTWSGYSTTSQFIDSIHYIPTSTIQDKFDVSKGYAYGNFISYKLVEHAATHSFTEEVVYSSEKVFFSYNQTAYTTIGDALNAGHIYITYGTAVKNDANLTDFMSWYVGMLIGTDTYGLPEIFLYIMRIFVAVSILATVWLVKDVLSL